MGHMQQAYGTSISIWYHSCVFTSLRIALTIASSWSLLITGIIPIPLSSPNFSGNGIGPVVQIEYFISQKYCETRKEHKGEVQRIRQNSLHLGRQLVDGQQMLNASRMAMSHLPTSGWLLPPCVPTRHVPHAVHTWPSLQVGLAV